MDDRHRSLESRLAALSEEVSDLRVRLRRLEGRADHATPAAAEEPLPASGAPLGVSVAAILGFAGRTFLVLGGAFLLRTMTDAGWIPRDAGIGVGLGYALVWTALAARAARTAATSAGFHALATVVIGYPILCEAVTSFAAISPALAAALIGILAGVGFATAVRFDLRAATWLHTLGATAAAVYLLFATREVFTFSALLLVLGLATETVGRWRDWTGPRWVTAAFLDLVLAWGVALVTDPHGLSEPYARVVPAAIRYLALALPLAYLASFAWHTLLRGREVRAFEIAQSALALVVGYGGAVHVTRFSGADDAPLGLGAFAAGLLCYAVAFAFIRRQQGRNRNFFFYSSLGLVLVLAGASTMASAAGSSLAIAALALLTAVVGGRFDRVTVRAHAAVFAVTAAVRSGLLDFVGDAFLAPPGNPHPGLSAPQGVVLVLMALSYVVLVTTRRHRQRPRLVRIPRFTIGVLAAAGIAATVVDVAVAMSPSASAATLAVVRTAVLAAAAVGLASGRRATGLREMGWPVYPLLVVGAAKLVMEDIPHGGPMTLFIAFAVYGAALLLAPRLVRDGAARAPTGAAGAC